MGRMRSRAPTVVVIAAIVAAWVACGPLTSQQIQPGTIFLDAPGSGVPILDATFDAPPDIAMEGGLPDAPPDASPFLDAPMLVDAPPDSQIEGGLPDSGSGLDAAPFDALTTPDSGGSAGSDAGPPDAGTLDSGSTVDASPTDAGVKLDSGPGGVTSARYDAISFYDCKCAGGGAPTGGWPILAAIALVIVRRRCGSSSAR